MNVLSVAGTILTSVVAPVFALIGMGHALARWRRADLMTLVNLNLHLLLPAFVFVRIVEAKTSSALWPRVFAFTVAQILLLGALGWGLGRILRAPPKTRSAMSLSVMIYNCGNFGVPVVTLAFGQGAVDVHIVAMLTVNFITFTLGVVIASGHLSASAWARLGLMFRQPSVLALLAAALVRMLGWEATSWTFFWNPIHTAADALIAVALITLGVQLAEERRRESAAPVFPAVIARLAVAPTLAFGLTRFFGFDQTTSQVLILGASAPTAINTALLAHKFDGDADFAASAVFRSTLASVVSVTVVLTLLKVAWS